MISKSQWVTLSTMESVPKQRYINLHSVADSEGKDQLFIQTRLVSWLSMSLWLSYRAGLLELFIRFKLLLFKFKTLLLQITMGPLQIWIWRILWVRLLWRTTHFFQEVVLFYCLRTSEFCFKTQLFRTTLHEEKLWLLSLEVLSSKSIIIQLLILWRNK